MGPLPAIVINATSATGKLCSARTSRIASTGFCARRRRTLPAHTWHAPSRDWPELFRAYPLKLIDWAKAERTIKSGRPDVESASHHYELSWENPNAIDAKDGFARVKRAGTGYLDQFFAER